MEKLIAAERTYFCGCCMFWGGEICFFNAFLAFFSDFFCLQEVAEAAQGLNIIITIIIITIIIIFTILIPFLLPLLLLFFAVFCINWFCLEKWSRWLEGLMEGGDIFFMAFLAGMRQL